MAIQQRASGLFARIQSLVDRVVSPATRRDVYANINTFSHEQPFLAVSRHPHINLIGLLEQSLTYCAQLFLTLQLLLSFTPLLLFLSFSAGVLLLSLVSAILFSLFWIGVALLVLVPTLFITVSLGVGIWVWAVSSFVIARWIYGILPVSVRGTTEVGLPGGRRVVVDKGENGVSDVKADIRDGA